MSMLIHRRFRTEVHRLVDGELAADRLDAIGTHLGACDKCRSDLGWWLAIRGSLLGESADRRSLDQR